MLSVTAESLELQAALLANRRRLPLERQEKAGKASRSRDCPQRASGRGGQEDSAGAGRGVRYSSSRGATPDGAARRLRRPTAALPQRGLRQREGAPMGLREFIKKQFIDVLQWTEAGDDVLA